MKLKIPFGRLVLPCALLLAFASTLPAQPRMEVMQPVWNFGAVTNLNEVSHEFVIRNSGDADLLFSKIDSGCDSCLRVILDSAKIAPGKSAVLRCWLDLRAYEGFISKHVTLHCNDPLSPAVTFNVVGTSVPLFRANPREIALNVAASQSHAVVELFALTTLQAPLSEVTCDNTNITGTVMAAGPDRFLVKLHGGPDLPHGRTEVQIKIGSPHHSDPVCVIKGVAINPPPFEVSPAVLRFRQKAEPQIGILWVSQRGPDPMLLLDAVPSLNKFQCEIHPDLTGMNYKIYVTAWDQDGEDGSPTISLKMLDKRQQEHLVNIPIVIDETISNEQ